MSYICKWGCIIYIYEIRDDRCVYLPYHGRGLTVITKEADELVWHWAIVCWLVFSCSALPLTADMFSLFPSLCVWRDLPADPPFFFAAVRPEVVFVSCRIVEGSTEEPHTQRGDLSGHARHKSLLFPNDFHQTTWSCDQIEQRKTQRFVLKFFDS